MSFGFPNFMRQRGNGILALRVGLSEIDFLFFSRFARSGTARQTEPVGVNVLSYGSEDISHFTVRQTLEKIFTQLPEAKNVQTLVATFPEGQFNAQVVELALPPVLPRHLIDKTEASLLEKDVLARASRIFQKSLFRESGILPGEFSLRKVKILERRIDGYPVPTLDGFKRGEIVCSILGMFLLETPFLPVEQFAKRHSIHDIRVIHIAETIESFAKKQNQDGVFLYVEEEKTQIVVQKEGHVAFLGGIPMGESAFTEFFGDMLGMRESTAAAFQKQYFQGNLSLAAHEKVQAYLLPEIKKFGTLIKEKLLGAQMTLPDPIWIFGKGRALRDTQNIFTDEELQDLPFLQKPETRFLLPKEIWEVKDFPGRNDPAYTTLFLLGESTNPQ